MIEYPVSFPIGNMTFENYVNRATEAFIVDMIFINLNY